MKHSPTNKLCVGSSDSDDVAVEKELLLIFYTIRQGMTDNLQVYISTMYSHNSKHSASLSLVSP